LNTLCDCNPAIVCFYAGRYDDTSLDTPLGRSEKAETTLSFFPVLITGDAILLSLEFKLGRP